MVLQPNSLLNLSGNEKFTFIVYGYISLGDETPPERFTSRRHRRRVCSWLKTGSKASETGSDDIKRL